MSQRKMRQGEIQERDDVVPESARLIIIPALKFGALTGSTGLLVGGVGGIIRSSTPGLFALASGLQWFALGSTFFATRGAIFHFYYPQGPTPNDRLQVGVIAGGFTGGAIGGLIRGRHNFVPGTVMFSLFGFAGQYIYNKLDARHTFQVQSTSPSSSFSTSAGTFWRKLASHSYSPMKVLSDAEYEAMLQERLLRVEAEIALVDEKIEVVKREAEMAKAKDRQLDE